MCSAPAPDTGRAARPPWRIRSANSVAAIVAPTDDAASSKACARWRRRSSMRRQSTPARVTTDEMFSAFAGIAHAARATTSLVVRALLLLVLIEGTASWVGFALGLAEGTQPPERERL